MQNPFIKNCRTGLHDDLLNRTSHYNKILITKSCLDNKLSKRYKTSMNQNKHQTQIEEQRQTSNFKLMKNILNIQKNYTRYLNPQEQESVYNGSSYGIGQKKSLKNKYLDHKKEIRISQDNLRLFKRITGVQSDISNDKIQKFNQKINKYAKLIVRPRKNIVQMDSNFYQTYMKLKIKLKVKENQYLTNIVTGQCLKTEDESEKNVKINSKRKIKRKHKKIHLKSLVHEQQHQENLTHEGDAQHQISE